MRQQPPYKATAITPSDSGANAYLMIYVGVGGDVALTDAHGTSVVFANVPAGQYIYCGTSKVLETDTNATNLIGLS